jgi:AMP-polyphosphate phosphotransferase
MKSADFVVTGRPRLDAIKHFPVVEFADYEHRLAETPETLRRMQQAYLGTSHRTIVVLEGWDTAGRGGVARRSGRALDPHAKGEHLRRWADTHAIGRRFVLTTKISVQHLGKRPTSARS